MTTDGFFSAVENFFDNDEVCVRSRRRDDLENLLDTSGLEADIVVDDGADYRYRVFVTKASWAGYLASAALDIDYNNFKGEISKHSKDHAKVYGNVWHNLYELQLTEERD